MSFFKKIKNKLNKNEDLKELRSVSFRDFLNGKIFTNKLIRRQYPFVILLVFISIIYIGNRYTSEKQIYQIIKLNKKIEDVKFESLSIHADLMRITTRSNILHLLKKNNMNIQPSNTPPIIIE